MHTNEKNVEFGGQTEGAPLLPCLKQGGGPSPFDWHIPYTILPRTYVPCIQTSPTKIQVQSFTEIIRITYSELMCCYPNLTSKF